MNRPLFVLAVLLAVSPAVRAQEFFGLSSSDVEGMIGQAQAEAHAQRLRELGHAPSRLPSLGKALGTTKTLSSAQNCVWDAAISRSGVTIHDAEWPDILYASDVDSARYRAAVKAQYPAKSVGDEVKTIYLSDYNVIYVADSASAYKGGATMDDALVGELTRWIDFTQKGIRDQATLDADAAAASAWYRATYPAGTSSCAR